MKHILLRSPKDPFEVIPPREVFERNLIGDNSGNLLFLHAVRRLLSVDGVEIESGGFSPKPSMAEAVNERYDTYVLPLANAFRPDYQRNLDRASDFIEKLKIPVAVVGVGAQSDASYDFELLRPMEASVRRFVSAVLERSPSVGVRGELTQSYLQGLGFSDVEVIGCPSMFLHGSRLPVPRRARRLDRSSRVSINVSPEVVAMGPILTSHMNRYPNLTYVAQDLNTLGFLTEGKGPDTGRKSDPMPFHRSHPLFRAQQARFYVEPWPWIRDLQNADFAFGTRIHGVIAALLAGTPAYAFAHDSRTLELVRYFDIPHRLMADVPADVDAADLYNEADFGPLVVGHAGRFATFAAFLASHGLRQAFEQGEDPSVFENRIAVTRFPPAVGAPPPVTSRWRRVARGVVSRMGPLRDPTIAVIRRWQNHIAKRRGWLR